MTTAATRDFVLRWIEDNRGPRQRYGALLAEAFDLLRQKIEAGEDPHATLRRVRDRWIICPVCEGDGTCVNPNIDAHGLTAEDFREDPDFAEDYFGGAYDETCRACGGRGSVRPGVVDRLREAAEDRRLAAREDGDFEAFSVAGDYRYGY